MPWFYKLHLLLIGLYTLGLFVLNWIIAINPSMLKLSQKTYQNLHALEYPTSASDLSLHSIKTPGLPMRLASSWELQKSLNMPKDALMSTYSMIYPCMEGTEDMKSLLSEQTSAAGKKYCASCEAQKVFTFENKLKESQKQKFCPKQGETDSHWLDVEFCRTVRVPSMALAHIATNTVTLFSSQNSSILLLYIVTVNVIFLFSMLIYKLWAYQLPQAKELHDKLNLGSLFSWIFLVMSILSVMPAFIDIVRRGDGKHSDKTSLGSLVLGIWTVTFSFMYIYVIPKMDVKVLEDVDAESETSDKRKVQDKIIIEYFVSRKPMISLTYWNFMLAPCVVLVVLSKNAYGIDLYMQFILFGTIAVTVLDIIHVRVKMIMGIVKGIEGIPQQTRYIDAFVFVVFLVIHQIISIPILIKLDQANVSGVGMFGVILVLYSHIIRKLIALVFRYYFPERLEAIRERVSNEYIGFEWSLFSQSIVSLITFVIVYTISIN
jgi:hypothetical protein